MEQFEVSHSCPHTRSGMRKKESAKFAKRFPLGKNFIRFAGFLVFWFNQPTSKPVNRLPLRLLLDGDGAFVIGWTGVLVLVK